MKSPINWSDLVGKTISCATQMKFQEYDDVPVLALKFTDGTSCFIVAEYGGYTGGSEDEYPRYIYITDDIENSLEPFPCGEPK